MTFLAIRAVSSASSARTWTGRALMFILLTAWLMTGCVVPYRAGYPGHWPQVVPADTRCPSLSGRYSNPSDASGSGWIDLADLVDWMLVGERKHVLPHAEVVVIDGPREGILTLRMHEGQRGPDDQASSQVGVRSLREGREYTCDRGWLVLHHYGGAPVLLMTGMTARLARVVDGSLVAEQVESYTGVLGYSSSSTWYLYRKLPH